MNIVSVLPFGACGKRFFAWANEKEKNNFFIFVRKTSLKKF